MVFLRGLGRAGNLGIEWGTKKLGWKPQPHGGKPIDALQNSLTQA
jgi:hypothetical protein